MRRFAVKVLCVGLVTVAILSVTSCGKQSGNGSGMTASGESSPGPATAASVMMSGQSGNDALIAQVVSVTPVGGPAAAPQQVCHDEVVQKRVPPKDQHRVAGTVIGAVAGGLLGHLVGGGKGNAVATAAGALGGGYAGNRIEKSEQDKKVENVVVHRCSSVASSSSTIGPYDVTYVYNGVTRTTRMDQDPGNVVKVDPNGVAVPDAH